MDDTRRFLRYILPGALFAAETIVLLALTYPTKMWRVVKELGNESSVATAVAGVVATGGIGYALSLIFHATTTRPNFTETVTSLVKSGRLKIVSGEDPNQDFSLDELNEPLSFVVVSAVWHQLLACSERVKSADRRKAGLADLVYSLGAALVASILSPVFAAFIFLWKGRFVESPLLAGVALLAAIAFIPAVLANHSQAARTYEATVSALFADALAENYGRWRCPFVTSLMPSHPTPAHKPARNC